MGFGSGLHWLIVLVIVVLVFGTKKLKNIGSDLGSAIKGFKDGMKDGGNTNATPPNDPNQRITQAADANTVDVQAKEKSNS